MLCCLLRSRPRVCAPAREGDDARHAWTVGLPEKRDTAWVAARVWAAVSRACCVQRAYMHDEHALSRAAWLTAATVQERRSWWRSTRRTRPW